MPRGQYINYTPEMMEFIRSDYKGVSNKEMAARIKEKFGVEIAPGTLSRKRVKMGCSSGNDGRFKKGEASYNKGKTGLRIPGSEKGWFRKGHIPKNHRPVGSERINVDGYYEIKVAEPRKWRLKHNVIWEQANDPIPKGYVVMFLDGDQRNLELSNLKLVHRRELLVMNRRNLINNNKEVTETGINIAKLIIAVEKKKSEKGKKTNA